MRATYALAAAGAVAAGLSLGCGGPCGSGAAARYTLRNDAITVEIQASPDAVTVKDASGRVLVASRGAGSGDGYGTLGWTSGKVFYSDIVDAGYFAVDTLFDPWRDQLRVTRALATPLPPPLPTTPGRRLVRMRISARAPATAGGLQVGAVNVARRLRWDLYIVD